VRYSLGPHQVVKASAADGGPVFDILPDNRVGGLQRSATQFHEPGQLACKVSEIVRTAP